MQIERLQRLDGEQLVGPGCRGVAADGEQGPDLTVALEQDLLGQGCGGHAAGVVAEAADPQLFAVAVRRDGRIGLRPGPTRRQQHIGVGNGVAGAQPAPADGLDRGDQVLGERATRGHVGPGSCGDRTDSTRREQPCCGLQLVGGHVGAGLDVRRA